ncbi:TPA: hypothetical protein N3A45_004412 [Salmonella enterica subsp. salamae serovar [1],40:z35:e,n,x,z15]|nr:hypothetical protein [Salmonella enterica]HCM2001207.1 hypothetical protein [Salmonella enterica subsp. salamae serovar [1],40:z35:e,n,x,z15]
MNTLKNGGYGIDAKKRQGNWQSTVFCKKLKISELISSERMYSFSFIPWCGIKSSDEKKPQVV